MTRDDAFIGFLEGYLDDYEGSTPLPESVRDAVRDQIVTTKQIRPLPGPMRYLSMITLPAAARYGAVAALAIGAVLVGAYALGPRNTTGGTADPEPTPTPRPFEDASGSLEPGRYVSLIDQIEISYTVPAGWNREPAGPELRGPLADDIGGLSFWTVSNVFADPCRFSGGTLAPPVGASVDDLAKALAEHPGIDAVPPSDVVVDGFAGKYVEYTTPATDCDQFGPWPTPNGLVLFPSTDARYWILDVDGTRLVMLAFVWDVATQEGRAALQGIIDSVEITP
jgi:hypothetical protein